MSIAVKTLIYFDIIVLIEIKGVIAMAMVMVMAMTVAVIVTSAW